MSSVAPSISETTTPARRSPLMETLAHTRYVLGENRVTAFAFGLLILIVLGGLSMFMQLSAMLDR